MSAAGSGFVGALRGVRRFLRDELWRAEFEPRTAAAWLLRGLRFAAMVGEGFVRDRLLLRASALTYFTVLSVVPLLAIVSALLTALGVTENVVKLGVGQLAAAVPGAEERVLEFVARADLAGLGSLGGAALFLATVFGIGNIERAFNQIWGVKRERPWSRRLPDYLAVLIVAPLLLGAGLSLAATLKSQWLVARLLAWPAFEALHRLGLEAAPAAVMALALAFLYWFLPNTSVRVGPALLGGVAAALLVNGALSLYIGFSVGFARAHVLYGSFAQLPLFFVWVYVFWALVLLGAEIAFACQNLESYRREAHGPAPGAAEREAIGLRIALEVARAFRDAVHPVTEEDLAEALGAPVRTVRDVLLALEQAGIVARRGDTEREGAVQLGRPAEQVRVADVLAALRGPREPAAGDPGVRRALEAVLAELEAEAGRGPANRTLHELLHGLPPAAPAPGRP